MKRRYLAWLIGALAFVALPVAAQYNQNWPNWTAHPIQRQASDPLSPSTTDGTLTWTFPTPFNNMPTCIPILTITSTSYTYDYPETTAISTTSVSILVTAHPKSITISSLTLPVVLQITPSAPPAGTAITLACLAPS